MAPSTDASVIHDIGYQRYTGPRFGRSYARRSLYLYSLRTAFGIGRGAKAKIFPWLVIGIALAVAVVAIALRSLTAGAATISYRGFVTGVAYPVIMFLAVVGPELVSRDLRDGVLPLYFSRPLTRTDYALAKYGALVTAVLLLLGVPQLIIYLGAIFTRTDGFHGALLELGDMGPGLAGAAIRSLVLAGIALLIASTTGRRAFAAAFIVAIFVITTPVVAVLYAIGSHGGPGGDGPGGPGGENQALKELAWLVNPMTLLNGVDEWFFGRAPNTAALIGNYGPVYGATALLLLVVTVTLLLVRYRGVAK